MNNFKVLREKIGLSQEELATKLNVSQQSVAKWESGNNMPRADKLPLIADALQCTIYQLYDGDAVNVNQEAEVSQEK